MWAKMRALVRNERLGKNESCTLCYFCLLPPLCSELSPGFCPGMQGQEKSTMGKHEEPESRAVAQSCGKHRGEKSHLYSSEPIWGEHTDLRNMFSPGCCLAGESVEKIYKLSDSWGKCLKELNLFSFSRKSGNDPIAQCMGTKEEKTEIYLSLGCMNCIREHYLACLFLTFSISKLEITFAQVQEVY